MTMLEISPQSGSSKITFSQLLEQYMMAVSLKKKGADKECLRIKAIMQRPITNVFLSDLTPAMIQKYINQRLETPSPRGGTLNPAPVRREFGILRSIFNWAVRMEMLDKPPPPPTHTQGVLLPKEPEARERTASKEDIERLLFACDWDGKVSLKTVLS